MIILVDIGNSNIVIATHNGKIKQTYRYNTDTSKSIDEYYVLLKEVIKDAQGMIISSVVPELNIIFKNLAIKYLNIEPMFIGPGVKTGVKITVDNPKEVGSDLVASAAAVISEYNDSAIVVDMGTATTLTYIENKVIKGVAITVGLVTSKDALVNGASQLSQFEFKTPKKVIETNTIDCLNSGLLYGHSIMIKGIVEEIKKQNKVSPLVIITGGASRFVKQMFDNSYLFDDLLLLKGLFIIYNKNN
ncbi:MAG: type III pantothenate kinase [Candidatus Izimaplasma sp.]|nr:type III pantothenate kinase [Candidatus Izimaplasma bacterium]